MQPQSKYCGMLECYGNNGRLVNLQKQTIRAIFENTSMMHSFNTYLQAVTRSFHRLCVCNPKPTTLRTESDFFFHHF